MTNCSVACTLRVQSNLLDAISFVLSDKYQNLRTEERQRLLYEGTGREVLAASVELLFDNTDSRFSGGDVVSIKRSIGLKKDEYFIDNKHCTKQEIVNTLESVGLSRSNPYYIVEQGKINALIRMKDAERLDLLREIAGTKTYDERKKESLKIMKETDYKVTQISDVITFLNERIDELAAEKNELAEYQQLDNQRRALEWSIYDNEMTTAVRKLEAMEQQRHNTDDASGQIYAKINECSRHKTEAMNKINEVSADVQQQNNELKSLNANKRTLIEERTVLELNISEYKRSNEQNQVEYNNKQKQLAQLDKQIADVEKKLADATDRYNAAWQAELAEQAKLNEVELRLQNLFAKQNSKTQYKTKKQRDTALNKQIQTLTQQIANVDKQIDDLNADKQTVQSKIESTNKLIAEKQAVESQITASLQTDQQTYNTLKAERNQLIDTVKETRAQLYDIQKQSNLAESKLQTAEHTFNKMVDLNVLNGMNSLKQVCRQVQDQRSVRSSD